ncbi:hypothetical protein [Mycobacterium parmense]|nr:hypothetical protein [Mycobacterium parmense]
MAITTINPYLDVQAPAAAEFADGRQPDARPYRMILGGKAPGR